MQMIPMRILFEKCGRVKYTSHLDTMRTMTRALKRSGLPLWYTEGYNPHLYNTFALPIALGYESTCETVDIRLIEEVDADTVLQKLNAVLPEGLKALRCAAPVMDAKVIAWADYRIELDCGYDAARCKAQLREFLAQPAIETVKKTKKGEKTVDLRPLCELLDLLTEDGVVCLKLRLASGNTLNINPTLFLQAFYDHSACTPNAVRILRTAIYDASINLFE